MAILDASVMSYELGIFNDFEALTSHKSNGSNFAPDSNFGRGWGGQNMGREGVSEGNGVLVYPIGWRAVCATSECHLALISTSECHQWTLCVDVVTRGGSSQK